jgi:hypothetical protein
MLFIAIGFFSLAALLGMLLLSYVLSHSKPPKVLAFTHGSLAIMGIILLIIYAFFYYPSPTVSMVLFILAALGGLTLLYRDIRGKTLPNWLAILHGIIAIVGLIFLVVFAFSRI